MRIRFCCCYFAVPPPPCSVLQQEQEKQLASSQTRTVAHLQPPRHNLQADPQADEPAGAVPPPADSKRNTLFDDIFNIPISVLHAVRRLLTNRGNGDVGANPDAQPL
ncbi:hypothetical protein B566_EDAN002634 [Ephemera danica]|nr:hypothetical protein B566_EDAN002634 [Ephemera danica]